MKANPQAYARKDRSAIRDLCAGSLCVLILCEQLRNLQGTWCFCKGCVVVEKKAWRWRKIDMKLAPAVADLVSQSGYKE